MSALATFEAGNQSFRVPELVLLDTARTKRTIVVPRVRVDSLDRRCPPNGGHTGVAVTIAIDSAELAFGE